MKIILKILFISIVFSFFSCDNFNDTSSFFSTDKDIYYVGDDIFLTIYITTEKKKRIKIYDNLQNIRVWVAFSIDYGLDNGESIDIASYEGIKTIEHPKRNKKKIIKEITITPEVPYVENIKGTIFEDDTNFILDFKDYGLTFYIDKEAYHNAKSLNFHGELIPINPAFGESFENFMMIHPIKIGSRQ